jgi:hypothetical protein
MDPEERRRPRIFPAGSTRNDRALRSPCPRGSVEVAVGTDRTSLPGEKRMAAEQADR